MNNKLVVGLFASALLLILSAASVGDDKTKPIGLAVGCYGWGHLQACFSKSREIDNNPYSQLLVLDTKTESSARCSMVLGTTLFIVVNGKSTRLSIDIGWLDNGNNLPRIGGKNTTAFQGLAM
ncbi:MAG: hypothetical protein WC757_00290 [Candidatus Paceibacterota bacterium]|jgi:hypothetical protein